MTQSIEQSLAPGAFIPYGQSWDFVANLRGVKDQLDAMVKANKARLAVDLYEVFLAGCYDKAGEVDDSGGNLGDFFRELFVSWIHARQRACIPAEDTIRCIVRWIDRDDQGFCYRIEGDVAKVLDRGSLGLFKAHFERRLDTALSPLKAGELQCIEDYPWEVRKAADALKAIYLARSDLRSYMNFCVRFLVSPKDCTNLAALCEAKKRWADALEWVDRGLATEKERRWGNESGYGLRGLRQQLLAKVGRREEAIESVWEDFAKRPSAYGYAELMKYVPRDARATWRRRAIQQAEAVDLRGFIEICIETREWEQLSARILDVGHDELESLGHYATEKAAQGLEKKHPAAAAKIYRALAMRIVKAGKSKYYSFALEHLRTAKRLFDELGDHEEWQTIVDQIRRDHARKRGFVAAFEEIVANRKPKPPESFAERSLRRWKQQTAE